ncbi:Ig-like domain-containing protein [Lyngbya aestuarii]|uniref:Ig-like domain-containing protein n=1 Tax=Lyngbya aestuarii TaxID=118322 RepID=UPI00403DDC6A
MATITVTNNADNGEGSLREAIGNAKAGDTIQFDSSLADETITLTSRQLQIDKDLTIDGDNAPGLTISGNKQNRVFLVNQKDSNVDFTLRNLTVADGFISNDRGGAIELRGDGSTLQVENVEFYNNVSNAGAISARENTIVTVIDSIFDGNYAAEFSQLEAVTPTGGAINVLHQSKLTVKNSQFTNNTGTYGGAVGTLFTETIIEDSTFLNNESQRFGGGLYVDGASWPDDPKYLPDGVEPKDSPGGKVIVRNTRFEGNRAQGFGGGIAVWGYDKDFVTIEDSQIINNQVTETPNGTAKGGGMRLGGFIDIKNTTVADNESKQEGGGLWYQGEVPANIDNSNFSGNKAADLGGAIYSQQWGSETQITDTTFEDNQASDGGGAIYKNQPKPFLNIEDSTFDNNGPSEFNDAQNILIKGTDNPSPGDSGTDNPSPGDSGTDNPDTDNPSPGDSGTDNPGNDNLDSSPVANPDTATTTQETAVSIEVLANDTNIDANPLTLNLLQTPSNGTVALDENGTPENVTDDFFLYTPNANFSGSDQFTYQIDNGQGGTDTAIVTVTVNPSPDPTEPLPPTGKDDAVGITLTPNSALITSEDGDTATFTVVLNSQPAQPVGLILNSGAPNEGNVGQAFVLFDQNNWNNPQEFTVTGADDNLADGDQSYQILAYTISADSNYNNLDVADIILTNLDNDMAELASLGAQPNESLGVDLVESASFGVEDVLAGTGSSFDDASLLV